MIVLLSVFGLFSVLPVLLSVFQSFKPMNELFLYPPRFFVRNPTLSNYKQLFVLMSGTWVPFSRYIFNTVLITVAGTAGNILVCSLAAYPLAKHRGLPGGRVMFQLVIAALMFNAVVTDVVNYITMSALHWINTYLAIIVPACGSALGLFIMKQFMEQIPDSLIEAAHIDGAGEYRIFWRIVMPNVKPAWLTTMIFVFQTIWNTSGLTQTTTIVYDEKIKMVSALMNQVAAGGTARAGAGAALGFLLMIPPVLLFLATQSRIIETMSTSGMK